jgi:two-component system sensor kinase FixL
LGLAISKNIIVAHGGSLLARNRPEGGSTFVFTIPLSA